VRLRATSLYADAWGLWRADWHILTAVAGMFVFLPELAMSLLIPDQPDSSKVTIIDINDPAFHAYQEKLAAWLADYGLLCVLALLIIVFGQFALTAIYLTPRRATVGRALLGALKLMPRLLLASMVLALPMGLLNFLLLGVPFLLVPITVLVTARMLLIAPAILAARPIGAIAAIRRSFMLTRGNTLLLASVVLAILLALSLVALPFRAFDEWLLHNGPNPVARMIVDAFIAGAAAVAAIAMTLVQVTAWRRLSSS